jgi:hypothetical protein
MQTRLAETALEQEIIRMPTRAAVSERGGARNPRPSLDMVGGKR